MISTGVAGSHERSSPPQPLVNNDGAARGECGRAHAMDDRADPRAFVEMRGRPRPGGRCHRSRPSGRSRRARGPPVPRSPPRRRPGAGRCSVAEQSRAAGPHPEPRTRATWWVSTPVSCVRVGPPAGEGVVDRGAGAAGLPAHAATIAVTLVPCPSSGGGCQRRADGHEETLDVGRRAPDDRVDPVGGDVACLGQRHVTTGLGGLNAEQLCRRTQPAATARRDADTDAVGRCVRAEELEHSSLPGEAGGVCDSEGHVSTVGHRDRRLETMRPTPGEDQPFGQEPGPTDVQGRARSSRT